MKGSNFVVMDKDTTQTKLYEHYLSFFLPEGMLDFFELVWMETESLTSKESQKDIAYTGVLHIHLDERDNRTGTSRTCAPMALRNLPQCRISLCGTGGCNCTSAGGGGLPRMAKA